MNNKVSKPRCRLYLITPPKIVLDSFKDDLAKACDGGDIACVQLRLKHASRDEILQAIDTLAPITQARNIAFILNDNPELAAQTACDGVHIGQKDKTYEQAREVVGNNAVVGVTCHDKRYLAIEAAEKGADYVAFGAFFPTNTKKTNSQPERNILEDWSTMTTVPCVAIGGITHKNCSPLIQAGADFLAVVSAIWNCGAGPGTAVKTFNEIIEQNC
jgi:thiamine-phosphate pyrophosphorylase